MRLNLSDDPITAELLAEALGRTGSAVIAVSGTSMHPTLQFGWRVYLRPARGDELKIGEIAVFRGDASLGTPLVIHRLVWRERVDGMERLVFRGDYNRARERVDPSAVIGRVVAIEVPGRKKGMERVVALESDVLACFYKLSFGLYRLLRPLAPRPVPPGAPVGALRRAARSAFAGVERALSFFLPDKRK